MLCIAVAAAVAFVLLDNDGDGWKTYRNDRYGYEVRYPPEWHLDVGERLVDPVDDFETQSVRFRKGAPPDPNAPLAGAEHGAAIVAIYVNFMGDWCLGQGIPHTERSMDVSGVPGIEYTCYGRQSQPCQPEPACYGEPIETVYFFEIVPGRQNYTIFAGLREDDETARRILQSFRFID
ncbi:MAG TPA: hypothetical protein VI759_10405 [Dehalococcoidia bacterium]|nr:hypothetical protein [Dehalococcoidia bacterium]